jgi:hypothetical protein
MRKSRNAAEAARDEEFSRTEVAGNHAASQRDAEKLAERRRVTKTQRSRAHEAKVPTRQS